LPQAVRVTTGPYRAGMWYHESQGDLASAAFQLTAEDLPATTTRRPPLTIGGGPVTDGLVGTAAARAEAGGRVGWAPHAELTHHDPRGPRHGFPPEVADW
jgi:hypothetical protein